MQRRSIRRTAFVPGLLALLVPSCTKTVTAPAAPVHPTGTAVYSTPLNDGPFGARISSQGLAYVSRPLTDSMARINLTGPTVIGSFLVGNRPDDIWFNASGSTAYVTNINDGTVGVINTATSTQTATYPVAAHPIRVLLGPGETTLYVTLDNGTVAVLDATNGALKTTLPVGGLPNGIVLTPSGSQVYVSSSSGTITEINTAANALGRTFTIGGTPQDLVVAPDGSTLYTANSNGWIDVRNLASGTRIDSIPVPGAFGLALTPDAAEIWATEPSFGAVAVITRATRTMRTTVYPVGVPRRIAFAPDGSVALVANEAGFVQVIP